MSITIYNQKQVAEVCKNVLVKYGYDPHYMETRMCGLTSSINLINIIKKRHIYDLDNAPLLLDILLKYNNQKGLSKDNMKDPDEFRSFSPEGDMYHKAAICIFEANDLRWKPILNPPNFQTLVNYLSKNKDISGFISVKNNMLTSGHLIVIHANKLYDPDPSTFQMEIHNYLTTHWHTWSSVLVSNQPIDSAKILHENITIKPIFETSEDIKKYPPGSTPWPIFIPDILVKDIRALKIRHE